MHEGLSLEKAVTSFFLGRDRKGWGGGEKVRRVKMGRRRQKAKAHTLMAHVKSG
jgi:hypothetical protein